MRDAARRERAAAALLMAGGAIAIALLGGCALMPDSGVPGSPSSGEVYGRSAPEDVYQVETTPTLPVAGKVLPPDRGAYNGFYSPPAPFKPEAIDAREAKAGRGMSIVMWYQPWAQTNRYLFDVGACTEVLRRRSVPMITWEPWNPGNDANFVRDPANQPAYRLQAIADGTYDAYIRLWADQIRAFGGPVMLRPMHEMNGNWYPWSGTVNGNSPELFVAAWKRMHDIFEEEGATNVTWVWSINHRSVPESRANTFDAYYPGDEYVDWTAISGFNWGATSPYSSWLTFDELYRDPLAYLHTLDKPIILAEFGCVEQGGDKAAWLRDSYARIAADPRIRGVIYYDALEAGPSMTQDWRFDTSARSLAGYSAAISGGTFTSTVPTALISWYARLSEAEKQYLVQQPIRY